MKIIDNELLASLSTQARKDKRLRKNFNLHLSLNEKVQRLLNALEPGTVIPVHRHLHTDETYVVLSGSLHLLLYDGKKNLQQKVLLDPSQGKYGVSIPAGTWHSVEVLEKGTVIFEVKQGPYAPISVEDILH